MRDDGLMSPVIGVNRNCQDDCVLKCLLEARAPYRTWLILSSKGRSLIVKIANLIDVTFSLSAGSDTKYGR